MRLSHCAFRVNYELVTNWLICRHLLENTEEVGTWRTEDLD